MVRRTRSIHSAASMKASVSGTANTPSQAGNIPCACRGSPTSTFSAIDTPTAARKPDRVRLMGEPRSATTKASDMPSANSATMMGAVLSGFMRGFYALRRAARPGLPVNIKY